MIGALILFAQVGAVQFQTHLSSDTVYVGQQVTYDAITLVDDVARNRLKANPEYTPPAVGGVTVYDFPFDTNAVRSVYLDGRTYRQYSYKRAMFPLTPGEYDIPPAALRYSLPESDGYYAERQTYTAHSAPLRFVAKPLPTTGRPVDFSGVVGEFADTLFTDGAPVQFGDGFTVTMRIIGVGNIALLPRPALRIPWADMVEGEERVFWDSIGTVVRGSKEFDWIVTPKVTGDVFIPEVRYDHFNPATHRYETAVTAPVRIRVAESNGIAGGVRPRAVEQLDDTPFPGIARFVQRNLVLVGVVVLIVAFVGIFLVIRAKTRNSS